MTFDEVIEEHRKLVGAEKVHLTLGPDATPEKIREILRKERETMADYNSFTKAEQEAAEKARLKRYLSNCFKAVRKLDLKDPNQLAVRNEVMKWSDIIPDVVAHEDIPWMLEQRRKQGVRAPNFKELIKKDRDRNSDRCSECGELHENCDPRGVGHYRG